MITLDAILIAADTSRSQAYAQALLANEMKIKRVLVCKPTSNVYSSHLKNMERPKIDVPLPDLNIPLIDTCEAIANELVVLDTESVNSPEVYDYLHTRDPKLIIYSGFAGQIVGSPIISLQADILHIHSGWLPRYRGSTTLYYSIIEEGACGVSAILLNSEIDKGVLVGRRKFALPTRNTDIDHLYDGAIRACLLVDVLLDWHSRDCSFKAIFDEDIEGRDFYVIHPILKHIAILSLEKESDTLRQNI